MQMFESTMTHIVGTRIKHEIPICIPRGLWIVSGYGPVRIEVENRSFLITTDDWNKIYNTGTVNPVE